MDTLQRPINEPPNLFSNTSRTAGSVAARSIGKRHAQILQLLTDRGPLTLWELAGIMGLHDHQISGRITELVAAGQIERTGETKTKPDTGCPAYIYRIPAPPQPSPQTPLPHALAEALGYPAEFRLDGDLYHAQPLPAEETWPGFPYARHTQGERPRLAIRVLLILCPACGSHLQRLPGGSPSHIRCPNPSCPAPQTWHLKLYTDPGRADNLALIAGLPTEDK